MPGLERWEGRARTPASDRTPTPGGDGLRRTLRVTLVALSLLGLLLTTSGFGQLAGARAAEGEEPAPLKAVVVVGPTHSLTSRFLGYGRAMADAAEANGMDVRRIFHPNATKKRVKKHAQGAHLFIYVGHGNGWPSAFGPFQERTKNGLGLNPVHGERTTANVDYKGADWLKEKIVLDPDAVVILSHLSYASGNASSGMAIPSRSVAVERIDNFANGFLAIGARVVWALGWQPGADVIDALHLEDATMDAIFMTQYREGVSPLNGWIGWKPGYYASVRTPGAEIHIDPSASDGYLRALTGELTFTTSEWRGGDAPPPDTEPPVIRDVVVTQSPQTVATGDSDMPVFTPNGDRLSDTIGVSHAVSERAFLDIRVTKGGKEVRRWTSLVFKGTSTTTWDGRRDDGRYVGDSAYRITITPRDRAGNEGEAVSARVKVLAALKNPSASPELFDPTDGDELATRTRFKARLTKRGTIRWLIRDASGAVVRRGIDDVEYGPGPVKWVWDGRDDAGDPLPRGEYTARVRVARPAGTYGHDVIVRLQPFRLRTPTDAIAIGSVMKARIRTAEPMKGKPRVTVKQRGVRTYAVKVKRVNGKLFTFRLEALRKGRSGPLNVVVSGTDIEGGEQRQRFRLTVR